MSRGGEGGQGVHGRSPGSRRKGAEQGVRSGHPAESTRDPKPDRQRPRRPCAGGRPGLGGPRAPVESQGQGVWGGGGLRWSHGAGAAQLMVRADHRAGSSHTESGSDLTPEPPWLTVTWLCSQNKGGAFPEERSGRSEPPPRQGPARSPAPPVLHWPAAGLFHHLVDAPRRSEQPEPRSRPLSPWLSPLPFALLGVGVRVGAREGEEGEEEEGVECGLLHA